MTWNDDANFPDIHHYYNSACILSNIWHKSSLASEGMSHVMTFDLDLYFYFDLGSDITQ